MAGSEKYLFIVQGVGRGHMTQAISMQSVLTDAGKEIAAVMIGKHPAGTIPEFVKEQLKVPLIFFESPSFVSDAKQKGIKIVSSILKNVMRLAAFRKSLLLIHNTIQTYKPDVIVNFYDPIIGLYYMLYRPKIPMVCVAHQYIYLHPGFEFPKGRIIDKWAIKQYTKLTSLGATKKLAISFYPINDYCSRGIVAIPPLLRKEVFQQEISNKEYLLVYIVNSGYMNDIIAWHKENPEQQIHCFTDKEDMHETWRYSDRLLFHRLNDKLFLKMMAGSKGLITTAGFESVCEAMYLGKPVFMVPITGHYEQYCNARDAAKAKAGIYDSEFTISKFMTYLVQAKHNNSFFRNWVDGAAEKVTDELHGLADKELLLKPIMA